MKCQNKFDFLMLIRQGISSRISSPSPHQLQPYPPLEPLSRPLRLNLVGSGYSHVMCKFRREFVEHSNVGCHFELQ